VTAKPVIDFVNSLGPWTGELS